MISLKYVIHRLFYLYRDSQEEKDFLRAVYERKAKRIKDFWRIER